MNDRNSGGKNGVKKSQRKEVGLLPELPYMEIILEEKKKKHV